MRITRLFLDQIEKVGMTPNDFFMVETGWFSAYAMKVNNQSQKTDRLCQRHMIPIERFERVQRLPTDHEKSERDKHLNIYTPQLNRKQPKQSRNMEVFLKEGPEGWTLISYWDQEIRRSRRDVSCGRLALVEINGQMNGAAFELLTPDSFGMCFQDEVDALLFAGVFAAVREDTKSLANKNLHKGIQSEESKRKPLW